MKLKFNNESAKPSHYTKDGHDLLSHLEHIFPEEEMRGAYRFNVIKYATRAGRKDDIVLELDKITEYAKRWKQFEQSLKKHDHDRVLYFKQHYYDGQQVLQYIDEDVKDDDVCRLALDGVPAYINPLNFVVCCDKPVCYSKKQLMRFFDVCKKDKFIGLEILIEKQKGQKTTC